MHIVFKVVIALVLLVGALLIFRPKHGNNSFKSDRPQKVHTYYYYPKANFYYDSTEGNYICQDTSSSTWKITNHLPVQEVDLGKRVRIGESQDPVWKENEHHRLIYSVSLYSEPNDFKKKEKPALPPKPKSDTVNAENETVKKSGVKKFLERIFPPKNKKDR